MPDSAADKLRSLIASTAKWRSMTGTTGNPSAALARIIVGEAPADTARPYAVIMQSDWGGERIAEPNWRSERGDIALVFVFAGTQTRVQVQDDLIALDGEIWAGSGINTAIQLETLEWGQVQELSERDTREGYTVACEATWGLT